MNYIYICLILMALIVSQANAQITIGSRKTPEPFSILELDTSNKGLRFNQLNQIQRDILTQQLLSGQESTKGLSIYNIETKKIQYWEGSKWVNIIGLDNIFSSDSYLQSKGNNKDPEWTTIKFPIVKKGEYYLYSASIKDDNVGCILSDITYNYMTYQEKAAFSGNVWTIIDGLTTVIDLPEVSNAPPDRPANKISIVFETSVQIGTGLIEDKSVYSTREGYQELPTYKKPYISFAIGFFIGNTGDSNEDYKLYLVRSDKIDAVGNDTSVKTYNIEGTLENLPPGSQTLKVAIMRRTQDDYMSTTYKDDTPDNILKRSLAVGTTIPGTSRFNDFMVKSFLRVETFVLDWD